jgi:UMF1 family MFS transporter
MSSPAAAIHPADGSALEANLRPVATLSWSLYDFANTIFSFTVVSYAMGLWLVRPEQFGPATGQLVFSLAILVSVGVNAIVSPILGALSDRGGRRLPLLLLFTLLCVGPTSLIALGGPLGGLILFTIANFAYMSALIYYDASLKLVSTPATRGRTSGIGVGIGYCGTVFVGLLLFFLDIPVDMRFVLAAVLYGLFAIPIFLVVREPRDPDAPPITFGDFLASWAQLRLTIAHARQVPGLSRFLLGRFFYSDAVNTVIVVMSIVAVQAVGFTEQTTVLILLLLTVVAILMSFVWGALSDRLGPRVTLIAVLISWAVGLILGALSLGMMGTDPVTGGPVPAMPGVAVFLIAGAILGSGLGGVQVTDRVFMVRLSPPERVGEFFGVYGLVGKASQVIGQLVYGLIVFLLLDSMGTGAYQIAILSLIVTMLIGLWLVWPVSDRWTGSGELHAHEPGSAAAGGPPPRLAPDRAPLDDRG